MTPVSPVDPRMPSRPSPLLAMLEEKLKAFSTGEDAASVARRLLQKSPSALDQLDHLLSRQRPPPDLVDRIKRLILTEVRGAMAGSGSGMPSKLESYVAFLDLFATVRDANADEGSENKTWRTFVLQDYDVRMLYLLWQIQLHPIYIFQQEKCVFRSPLCRPAP